MRAASPHCGWRGPRNTTPCRARCWSGLKDAAAQIATDDAVRAVILAAEGKTFCAGGDLAWMKAQMAADPATRRAEARLLAEALQALNTLPKPLIGRVQGNAFGGGVGLISVCDTVLGVTGAPGSG
jgi:methylglutaconyl-CoA hydratase